MPRLDSVFDHLCGLACEVVVLCVITARFTHTYHERQIEQSPTTSVQEPNTPAAGDCQKRAPAASQVSSPEMKDDLNDQKDDEDSAVSTASSGAISIPNSNSSLQHSISSQPSCSWDSCSDIASIHLREGTVVA